MIFSNHIIDGLFWISILLWFSLNARGIYFNVLIRKSISQKKNLPKRLRDCPVHDTSIESYDFFVERIKKDIEDALMASKKIDILISKDDINNLYLRGTPIDKYRACPEIGLFPLRSIYENEYVYFDVLPSGLSRMEIRYPDLYGRDGVITQTQLYKFKKIDLGFRISRQIIEYNGREYLNGKNKMTALLLCRPIEVDLLPLDFIDRISYLLGYSTDQLMNDVGINLKDILQVLERIDSINFFENKLVVSIAPSSLR